MDIKEKKDLVIKAGIRLMEAGLIARTWGNVSCRIDEDSFLITPSGRSYLTLTPEEIVEVKISDLTYTGNIKPSSEKGIHAEAYKLFPKVNFVIHTHQEYASAISACGLDSIRVLDSRTKLPKEIICATYGLPGTKKLKKNVAIALKATKGSSLIMKNHGALCFGESYEATFQEALELEAVCEEFLRDQYLKLSKKDSFDKNEMNYFALSRLKGEQLQPPEHEKVPCQSSRRFNSGFVLLDNKGGEIQVKFDELSKELPIEATFYNSIYKKYKAINYIKSSVAPELKAVSCYGSKVKPLLDDFAQIAGREGECVPINTSQITAALKNSSVVFLHKEGALCCGKTINDAEALELVTIKNCKALIACALLDRLKPINSLECRLMRFVYLKKYSLQAYESQK